MAGDPDEGRQRVDQRAHHGARRSDAEEQHDGQAHQHDARDAAFTGQGLDLAQDAEPLADDVADLVENDIGAMTPEQRREALRKWAK